MLNRAGAFGLTMALFMSVSMTTAIDEPPPVLDAIDGISAVMIQSVTVPADTLGPIDIAVRLGDEAFELNLVPHSMRADGFRVLVPDGVGGWSEPPPPRTSTYRGTVEGISGSLVSASLRGGALHALIDLGPGRDAWCVEPTAVLTGAPRPRNEHAAFRRRDVEPGDGRCGADELDPVDVVSSRGSGGGGGGGAAGDPLMVAEIAIDADWQYFVDNGSSIDATVADIEAVMNDTELIYERDAGITYEITGIVIRTTEAENPYTTSSPSDLLCEFRTQWNEGLEIYILHDVAQLFTGRDLSGSIIGIAWLNAVCTFGGAGSCPGVGPTGYGVVQSRYTTIGDRRAALSAHELGHNWGAGHCNGDVDCHIMCSSLNGCDGVEGENLRFGPSAVDDIVAYRDTVDCLAEAPAPLAPPLVDHFVDLDFDPAKWSWVYKVQYSTDGIDEPSPASSMLLNAANADPFRDDEIRSNAILLADEPDVRVSFATEHVGVEAGERLLVEYWSAGGAWTELAAVTSDGVDQDAFVFHEHPLPGDGYHDGFRLRFRVEADEPDDRWFVDDVYAGPPPPACPADVDGSGAVGFTDVLAVLSAWGPCAGCAEDLDGSGVVGFADLLAVLSAWGPC